jgi:3-deoxy-D-manno-octulosonate 8-phosphate phosphatase (KDO 8-P phosphatase)
LRNGHHLQLVRTWLTGSTGLVSKFTLMEDRLPTISPGMMKKVRALKAVVFDCDGVMTNGQVFYNGSGQWIRFFNIFDGMGIKRLQEKGFHVGMITNSDSEDIRERCKKLGIEDLYEGVNAKQKCLAEFCKKHDLVEAEVAYMGDDLQDVPVLNTVGFAVTVPHALDAVKEVSHLVTQKEGGMGAVRELSELILSVASIDSDK